MSEREACVYALVDPRSDEPRYVGATVDVEERFEQHLSNSNNEKVREWIEELDNEGLKPDMKTLRWVDSDDLREEEQDVLDSYFEQYDLLNGQEHSGYPDRENDGPSKHNGRYYIGPASTKSERIANRVEKMAETEFASESAYIKHLIRQDMRRKGKL